MCANSPQNAAEIAYSTVDLRGHDEQNLNSDILSDHMEQHFNISEGRNNKKNPSSDKIPGRDL